MKLKTLWTLLSTVLISGMAARAADPNPPAIINPTAASAPNGIAPNGIDVTLGGIFFTEPFADQGVKQDRGIYSITTAGVVTKLAAVPGLATLGIAGSAENALAIAPGLAGSGFTAGLKFATGNSINDSTKDAVYMYGSGSLFVDGIPATVSKHNSGLGFDTVGTFGGALIVTADNTITLYNASGTKIAGYTGPGGFVLQASTVAPVTYSACPGCLFTTAFPAGNIDSFPPLGNGKILTVAPGTPDGAAASEFIAATPFAEPESIHFVTEQALSCNIGGFSYFASAYATGNQMNTLESTSGAVLAWTPAQLAPFVGHFLVQNEEGGTALSGVTHGTIYVDGTATVFSDTTTTSPLNTVGYQLEDTSILQCPVAPPTGCPATQGFWHKASRWPDVTVGFDGVIYNGATDHSMVIGGIKYSQSQLLLIMPSGALHTGGYVNALSQLVAAILNIAAGAQHTATIDAAILAMSTDLFGHPFISGTSLAPISDSLKALLQGFESTLDNYNSAVGLGCHEGSGLHVGN